MVAATVAAMALIGAFARRVLGMRVGVGRILLAGIIGLGAGVGFESRFVWGVTDYSPALIPVQIGIILLVAIAFLVIAELIVPQGTIPRPDQWATGCDTARSGLGVTRSSSASLCGTSSSRSPSIPLPLRRGAPNAHDRRRRCVRHWKMLAARS